MPLSLISTPLLGCLQCCTQSLRLRRELFEIRTADLHSSDSDWRRNLNLEGSRFERRAKLPTSLKHSMPHVTLRFARRLREALWEAAREVPQQGTRPQPRRTKHRVEIIFAEKCYLLNRRKACIDCFRASRRHHCIRVLLQLFVVNGQALGAVGRRGTRARCPAPLVELFVVVGEPKEASKINNPRSTNNVIKRKARVTEK